MRKTLKALQDRKAQLVGQMRALLDAASTENRALTAEEDTKYAALEGDLQATLRDLAREQALQEAERTATATATSITDVHDRAGDAPFVSLGEQLQAVIKAGTPGGSVDPRLYAGPSGASAAVGADGGFLIRKDFSATLISEAFETGILSQRCDSQEISANADGLEVPYVNETSRATGSRWGGVQVYRRAEADTVTATKPGLGLWECRLEDMMGLAYVTERLMQDAGAMAGVFSRAFRSEMGFKLDDEIYRGTGTGQCLGVLTSDALVTVAKETGQAADTVVAENIINMWSRLLPRSKANAVWVINTEVTPQLHQMQIGTGASGQLVYLPPGGLSGAPYGTIYGRPVLEVEQASALGDLGDIALLDLSQYMLITKGGIAEDQSIHVRFIYNERALRWTTRVNGAPKIKSALTPYKGSKTLSPFVTLAAR